MSKIFGVPLVLIALVLLIVSPLLAVEILLFREVSGVKREVMSAKACEVEKEIEAVNPTPSTTPSRVAPLRNASPSATGE